MIPDQQIPFIFENGVLRPEGPVDLPEGARGIARLRPLPAAPNPNDHERAIGAIRRIAESGVFNSAGQKLTRDEMHKRG